MTYRVGMADGRMEDFVYSRFRAWDTFARQ